MKHAMATTKPRSAPPGLAPGGGSLQRAPRQAAASKVGAGGSVPPIVRDVVGSPGQPLDPQSRALMEARFGHDFSRVRVHADGRAARSAEAVDAAAYTVGERIAFGAGRYAPGTAEGRRLLAHELAHVVQQGPSAARRPRGIAPADAALEVEAERAAAGIGTARPAPHAQADLIQRSPLSDALRKDLGAQPTVEAVLARLSEADVQAAQNDGDVDAEVARVLAGRADDLWVAQRVRQGRLGETTGALGPKSAGRPVPRAIEAFFFRGVTTRRALVIAGVHGTERQGIEVARMLIADLKKQQPQFTVIVVPTLFPDNAARGAFGTRESGGTPTNRNFPPPHEHLAAARKAGGTKGAVDASTVAGKRQRAILPENVMLMELMERFRPERIISIHGTFEPSAAGVFYDPRAPRSDEINAAYAEAAKAAYSGPVGRVHYPAEGEEKVREEIKEKLFQRRLGELRRQASETDTQLSLAAAARIDAATAKIAGRERRVMGRREDDPATVPKKEQEARKEHPSVAGNVGRSGALDRPTWSGSGSGGVSLGEYAPARGMSVFTVEPPINRNTRDYPTSEDTITVDDRRVELQAYADAVRTVLLGS